MHLIALPTLLAAQAQIQHPEMSGEQSPLHFSRHSIYNDLAINVRIFVLKPRLQHDYLDYTGL